MKLFLCTLCFFWTTTIIAQFSTLNLSEGRCCMASVTAGNRIFFGGGVKSLGIVVASKTVDIFNLATQQWTTAQLSVPRSGIAAAQLGKKILFAGGDFNNAAYYSNVDIYDTLTNQWTVYNLPIRCTNMAAVSHKGKAYFGGGTDGDYALKTVHIYDGATDTWTMKELSIARSLLTATAVGDKILFAGGTSWVTGVSNVVDIYNTITNTWSTAQLSQARFYLKSATIGSKVFFVGGLNSNRDASNVVDIYDDATGIWSTTTLTSARLEHGLAVIGTKLYVGGGENYLGTFYKSVEVYNATTNSWEAPIQLSEARTSISAASLGNHIFFAGGDPPYGPMSNVVDVFPADIVLPIELLDFIAKSHIHTVELTWKTASEKNASHFDIERSVDGKQWEKLGRVKAVNQPSQYQFLDDTPLSINYYRLRMIAVDGSETVSQVETVHFGKANQYKITPNPTHGDLNIALESAMTQDCQISVYDLVGRKVVSQKVNSNFTSLNLNALEKGIYIVEIQQNGKVSKEKIVKM
jgi:Secretion system C-terminal sorting domain/Kelch motif